MAIRSIDSYDDDRDKTVYAFVFMGAIIAAVIVTLVVSWSAYSKRYAPEQSTPPPAQQTSQR